MTAATATPYDLFHAQVLAWLRRQEFPQHSGVIAEHFDVTPHQTISVMRSLKADGFVDSIDQQVLVGRRRRTLKLWKVV